MPVELVAFMSTGQKGETEDGGFPAEVYTGETTLQDYAYKQIKQWLEKGNLKSGDRIKESVVAKTLDISRVPVREAALRLQSEGFLKSLPRGGFIVPRYTLGDVCYLYEMREAIEGMSARLAAQRAFDSEIYRIKEFNDQMRDIYDYRLTDADSPFYAEYGFDLHKLDTQFHRSILKAGKNPYAMEITTRMGSQLLVLKRSFIIGGDMIDKIRTEDRTIESHQSIVEALLERDADKAEYAARDHIRASRANFERLAEELK